MRIVFHQLCNVAITLPTSEPANRADVFRLEIESQKCSIDNYNV